MIDPINMTVRDWADSVVLSIGDTWGVGRLDDETRWQDWAIQLLRAYSPRNLPDPYAFGDWRDWARRAYPMLETVTA